MGRMLGLRVRYNVGMIDTMLVCAIFLTQYEYQKRFFNSQVNSTQS